MASRRPVSVAGSLIEHIGDTTRGRSMGDSMVGLTECLGQYPDKDKDPLA